MSFLARSFIFDGIASEEFNLVIANIGNSNQDSGVVGSELKIIEDRIPRRYRAIHYGTIGNEPLSFPIVFSVAKDNTCLDRYDIARVSAWLTCHKQYKKLVIDQTDLGSIYYNCIITGLKQIEIGGKTVGFEAIITCDSPFAYRIVSDTIIECADSLTTTYHCLSNVNDYYWPDMIIKTSAAELTISNDTDGTTFTLSGMPSGQKTITINGESLIMESSDGTNLYDCWNVGMPKYSLRALRGYNQLTITGACTITIKNEFPWNIGY